VCQVDGASPKEPEALRIYGRESPVRFLGWRMERRDDTGRTPAGTSKIELVLDDCVVLENWTSLGVPYSGKSYNTYNASLKRWEQFWVDNVGGMIYFYGGLKDGVMDYYTDEVPQPDGTKLKRHLQFF